MTSFTKWPHLLLLICSWAMDDNGNARWMAVNVSVGNFVKQRVSLQDFEANIILPETNVQSL